LLNLETTDLMDGGMSGMLATDTALLSNLADDSSLNSILLPDPRTEKMIGPGGEDDVSVFNDTRLSESLIGNIDGGFSSGFADFNYLGDSENSGLITNGSLDLYVHANLSGSEGGGVL